MQLKSILNRAHKSKQAARKPFDFRTFHAMSIALYHALGALPEPEFTQRSC